MAHHGPTGSTNGDARISLAPLSVAATVGAARVASTTRRCAVAGAQRARVGGRAVRGRPSESGGRSAAGHAMGRVARDLIATQHTGAHVASWCRSTRWRGDGASGTRGTEAALGTAAWPWSGTTLGGPWSVSGDT